MFELVMKGLQMYIYMYMYIHMYTYTVCRENRQNLRKFVLDLYDTIGDREIGLTTAACMMPEAFA